MLNGRFAKHKINEFTCFEAANKLRWIKPFGIILVRAHNWLILLKFNQIKELIKKLKEIECKYRPKKKWQIVGNWSEWDNISIPSQMLSAYLWYICSQYCRIRARKIGWRTNKHLAIVRHQRGNICMRIEGAFSNALVKSCYIQIVHLEKQKP